MVKIVLELAGKKYRQWRTRRQMYIDLEAAIALEPAGAQAQKSYETDSIISKPCEAHHPPK
jgi:hypothetical protein